MTEQTENKGNGGNNLPSQEIEMISVPTNSVRRENGRTYILKDEIEKYLSGKGYALNAKTPTYSPIVLKSYDKVRHIALDEAHQLIESQNDSNLSVRKLSNAIENKQIKTYQFNGQTYLDRLDIGRVYHQEPQQKRGLTIERYFTQEGQDPFSSVEFEKRDLKIEEYKNGKPTGNVIFEMKDAEFPVSWNNNQATIVAQKYFFKPSKEDWKQKLKDTIGEDHESSVKHLMNRVTNFIADEGLKLGYFATEKDRNIFADELKWLQINRKFAFNSPVQFNVGINNTYGISGSQGIGYWKNPETGEVEEVKYGEFVHPQAHACFIKGPRDDLDSILNHSKDEGAIFSLGSGIGQDIGVLRAEGEPLSGGGKASGPLSFWEIYDVGAGTVKSGGKSRRAARMTTMRYHHPDIMKFIQSKVREDKKALVLMQNGYKGGMDGEAVRTVTFQNTNISVRLDDYFFEQVKSGGEVELKYIKSEKIAGKVSADRMLKEISFGSWRIGDPAVQYESKIQEMHTAKNSGRIQSSNPCSEFMFLDDNSCNLNSQNLVAYADEKGNFNTKDFEKGVYISTVAAEIFNTAASLPVKDIAIISPEFRTVGVGYAGLGHLLMRRGVAYDSDEGRAIAGAITALMTGKAYEASSDLAEGLGTFTHFEFNKKPMNEVMEKHRKNLEKVLWEHVPSDLKEAAYSSWDNVVRRGKTVGFRNAQATLLAPTGTISYLLGTENSTGVEPSLMLLAEKNLAGGGSIFIASDEIPNALKNLGYNEKQIKDITNFVDEKDKQNKVRSSVVGAPHLNPNHYPVFATAMGGRDGSGSIPFEGHIKMLAATQPFLSGAISKTNNLPESATVKEIYDGFILGHKLGLKAVAVFRNNSKPTQAVGGGKVAGKLKRGEKEDLPSRRIAYESEVEISNSPFHVIVSEYTDGRPGQITFLAYKEGSTMGALLSTHGIMASKALKRGVDLEGITKGWIGQDFEPKGFVSGHPYIKSARSFLDFAGKFLKLEYLGDAEMSDVKDVKIEDLRGHSNGAFRTYSRMNIDGWNVDQVLNDSELGGFTKVLANNSSSQNNKIPIKENGNEKNNERGVMCNVCGNIMRQTAPGCFSCNSCGDGVGGCGL